MTDTGKAQATLVAERDAAEDGMKATYRGQKLQA